MKKIDDNQPTPPTILKYLWNLMKKGKYFYGSRPFISFIPFSAFRLIYFSKA